MPTLPGRSGPRRLLGFHSRGQPSDGSHRVDVRVEGDVGLEVGVGVVQVPRAVPAANLESPSFRGHPQWRRRPARGTEDASAGGSPEPGLGHEHLGVRGSAYVDGAADLSSTERTRLPKSTVKRRVPLSNCPIPLNKLVDRVPSSKHDRGSRRWQSAGERLESGRLAA